MITEDEWNELIRDGLIADIGAERFAVFFGLCFGGDVTDEEISVKVGVPARRVAQYRRELTERGLAHWWEGMAEVIERDLAKRGDKNDWIEDQ